MYIYACLFVCICVYNMYEYRYSYLIEVNVCIYMWNDTTYLNMSLIIGQRTNLK